MSRTNATWLCAFICAVAISFGAASCGRSGERTGTPTTNDIPFGVLLDKLAIRLPMPTAKDEVYTKNGFHFLCAVIEEVKGDQEIAATEVKAVVVDGKGKKYDPIGFGFPAKVGNPFVMSGASFESSIMLSHTKQSVLVVFFFVPDGASKFTLRTNNGKSFDLPIYKAWQPPESLNANGYETRGPVSFSLPALQDQGWGVKVP